MSLKSSIRAVLTLGRGVFQGIPDADEGRDPIGLFQSWFAAAQEAGIMLPEAAALGTASAEGIPSVRMVLNKGADENGFVFFTNYGSRKAVELEENPNAALCFHWPILERQVRVVGSVERLTNEESDAYFQTRPRGSRIGAWASKQSQPLEERALLEERVRTSNERFDGDDVPLPEFWGGYRIVPTEIEFWQGRADRLHDRIVFRATPEGWTVGRLYP